MPLQLPNLDDRTYAELVAEAQSLIQNYAPEWTNYNSSDPGITLIELFAYLTEMLNYRLNRVTDANKIAFLQLLKGSSDWQPSLQKTLNDEIRDTVLEIRQSYRAITCEDFEHLAIKADLTVARARCVPRQNWESENPLFDSPGHISVVIISNNEESNLIPNRELIDKVKLEQEKLQEKVKLKQEYQELIKKLEQEKVKLKQEYQELIKKTEQQLEQEYHELVNKVKLDLEPRRLLTTRIHVVKPSYITIDVQITLLLKSDALKEVVRPKVSEALREFFNPLKGGSDGKKWQFGRSVYVSEIYELLDNVQGVDYVEKTNDLDELTVSNESDRSRLQRNEKQQLVSVKLHPYELVKLHIDNSGIKIKTP